MQKSSAVKGIKTLLNEHKGKDVSSLLQFHSVVKYKWGHADSFKLWFIDAVNADVLYGVPGHGAIK